MTKYHISPATGRPNICRAGTKPCPMGGEHFATKEEARGHFEASEKQQEVPEPFTKALQKLSRWEEIEAQVTYTKDMNEKLALAYEKKRKPVEKIFKEITPAKITAYNESYRALEKNLTQEEKDAMHNYTGITYMPVNKYCTDPEKFIKENKFPETIEAQVQRITGEIEAIDSFLKKATSEERVVFRRLDQDKTKEFTGSEEWGEALGYREGAVINFPAYSSTTIDPAYIARTTQDDANTSIVLVLKTSKGAPVDYTAVGSERKNTQEGEREILLPRGMAFKVRKIERVGWESSDYPRAEALTIFLEEA